MDNQEVVHNSPLTPQDPDSSSNMGQAAQEPTIGQWLAANAFFLFLVGALFLYLFLQAGLEGIGTGFKVALGLSLVIFIHELGHFLVAKWCDVHVTTFSIGFGPAIPGCSFHKGETTYKLAMFPLGGYVQMVGQVDGDESGDGSENDPRSYRNKTVWQRMAIISAGVVMNVILAIICFVVVFQGPGKDRRAGVIDSIEAGSPGFIHGLRTGDEILRIAEIDHPFFENLMTTVMATVHGQKVPFEFQRPGDAQPTFREIEPRLSKEITRPMIGISPAYCLQLEQRRTVDLAMKSPAFPQSPAATAQPPFQFDDRIVATTDPENPAQIKPLPLDARKPNSQQRDYFEFARRMSLLAGQEVTIRVERGSGEKTESVDIKVLPAFHQALGAVMQMGEISALRQGSPAEQAKVQARNRAKNLEGDVILRVDVKNLDGSWRRFGETTPLDPLRLPFELRQWARELHAIKPNPDAKDRKVFLHVHRHSSQPGQQYRKEILEAAWDNDWQFDKVIPFTPTAPLAIPELGLAYQVKTTVARVDSAQESQGSALHRGDVIKKVRFSYPGEKGKKENGSWVDLEPEEFAWVFWRFNLPGHLKTLTFQVERDKKLQEITVEAREDRAWPLAERGLILSPDVRRQKAGNIFEAVALGLQDTHNTMLQVFQNLRGMLTGRISVKNLGGPVMIAQAAYKIAGYDIWEFVFFIGLISINLAVINFLPIPVLDGGHMVFLIYEKIRGKPASEGIRIGATYAGLALILFLMVFVLFQDISRLLRG